MINALMLLGLALPPFSAALAADSPSSKAQAVVAQSVQDFGLRSDTQLPPAPQAPGDAGPADETHIVTQCETLQTPIPWSYCISQDKDSTSSEVLYWMHGLGSDEKSWRWGAHPSAIRAVWRSEGKQPPIAVSISFGPFWLLSEKNSSPRSGLLPFLTDYAIPFIEKEKLGGVPRKRLLIGESMGGFNSTELILTHPDLFERAAIVCPAIVNVSPYATDDVVNAYIQRTGADPEYVHNAISLSRAVFPDEASWETAAPLTIGKTLLDDDFPPLHLSCGDKDQYGFEEGAKAFADLARDNGVNVVWEPLSGGHCVADPAALADFLIPTASK